MIVWSSFGILILQEIFINILDIEYISDNKRIRLRCKILSFGNQLTSASKDETVKIWINNAEGNSFTIKAHNAPIRALDYSYDGKLLLTCSDDKTIKVHRI